MSPEVRIATVGLADVEPVTGFIAKTCRAEAWMRQLTPEQVAALPDAAVAAMTMLQQAVRDLAGHLPTMAAILNADPEAVTEGDTDL